MHRVVITGIGLVTPIGNDGVAAGMMAVEDAGLGTKVPAGQEDRWGVFIGASLGGVGHEPLSGRLI